MGLSGQRRTAALLLRWPPVQQLGLAADRLLGQVVARYVHARAAPWLDAAWQRGPYHRAARWQGWQQAAAAAPRHAALGVEQQLALACWHFFLPPHCHAVALQLAQGWQPQQQ